MEDDDVVWITGLVERRDRVVVQREALGDRAATDRDIVHREGSPESRRDLRIETSTLWRAGAGGDTVTVEYDVWTCCLAASGLGDT